MLMVTASAAGGMIAGASIKPKTIARQAKIRLIMWLTIFHFTRLGTERRPS
jgi:hypothetical protein